MGPKRLAMLNLGLLVLRVLMGTGIAMHGQSKVFGGHIDEFAQGVAKLGLPGDPHTLAWVAAFSEFAGGILIAIGLLTRVAALSVLATMAVAVFLHHASDPFKVKELAIAYGTIAGTLVLTGPGAASFDAWIAGAIGKGKGPARR
jgi:putative oxidoreductase